MHVKRFGFAACINAAYTVVDGADEWFIGERAGAVVVRWFGDGLLPEDIGMNSLQRIVVHKLALPKPGTDGIVKLLLLTWRESVPNLTAIVLVIVGCSMVVEQ